MKIGERLKSRRKELGLSMKEVADRIGVAEATVSRWESGDIANMKRNYIKKYAEILGVSPLYIMGISDDYIYIDKHDLGDIHSAFKRFASEYIPDNEEVAETAEYLEQLHSRPEMRMLFKSAKTATKGQIESIVKMLESFKES